MDLRGTLALLLVLGTQAPPQPAPGLVATPAEPDAALVVSLFDGRGLDAWELPGGRRERFSVVGDVLRVRGRSGRLVTRRGFDDFVLTLEARQVDADSVGGVLIRSLPLPPATPSSRRRLAFEVPVATGRNPSVPLLMHVDDKVEPAVKTSEPLLRPDNQWHRYHVECSADRVRVRRDDTEVADITGVPLNTGPLALYAARGRVEFRNLTVRIVNQQPAPPVGAAVLRQSELRPLGVVLPRVLKDVKPQYTASALHARIQGTVRLECVVAASGRVEWCSVVQRVSTGLDAEAVAAARQWEFEPATRDGTPVAVMVTLEMDFALK
jgi:TonB family protein